MKSINFINTLSAKQHSSLHRWWRISLVLFSVLIVTIVGVQSMQLYTLYGVVSRHTLLQGNMQKAQREHEPYMALKKEEDALRAQRIKIDHIYHTAEHTGVLLAALYATGAFVRIQSCKLNKNDFELIVQSPTADFALNEIKRLRVVNQLQEVKLISLQQSRNDTSMVATIKGKIRKI